MVHKTRHARKHKKHSYRHKTQKGGFTPAIISGIAHQISSRLGPVLSHLLERAQASGSAQYAAQGIAETGGAAAEALAAALRQVVSEAVSKTPALASSSGEITNEILTAAAARMAQSASVTAGPTAAPAAAALTVAAGAALTTAATAAGTVLVGLLKTASRNPQVARSLLTGFRESVLPAIQRQVQRFMGRGNARAALEAPVSGPVSAAARPLRLGPSLPGSLGPSLPGRLGPASTGRRRFAEAVVRQGMAPRRTMGTVTGNASAAAARARANANAARAPATGANGNANASAAPQANASASPPSSKRILTDAEVDALPREQLKRIYIAYKFVGQNGPLSVPSGIKGTQTMRDFTKSTIMPAWRQEYKAMTGRNAPPPSAASLLPKPRTSPAPPTTTELVSQSVKERSRLEGGGAPTDVSIDKALVTSKNQIANEYDILFTASPGFIELLTNPEELSHVIGEIPEVVDNAVELAPTILNESVIGKAIESLQITRTNAPYYKRFGRLGINFGSNAAYIAGYNENVAECMRMLLSRASRSEVQNLLTTLTVPRMQAFRVGILDLFLTSPLEANRVLQTMVGQILPFNDLTPVAFDTIITTLQQNPENISVVLERIVRERAQAEQEVSFAARLWRSRGAGQTTGRYGIMSLGVIAILFLFGMYGFTSPNDLLFFLNRELSTFGLSDVLSGGINTLDRFYDALHFAVLGRNAERAVSTGVVAPAASTVEAIRTWWSGFIRAGHPPTVFEALVENVRTILDRVGRDNAMFFAGVSVISIVVFRARQLAIDHERAQLAALPPPPGAPPANGGPPPPPPGAPPGNGGPPPPPPPPPGVPPGNGGPPAPNANFAGNNAPYPNLSARAMRPRENFGVARLPSAAQLAARVPLPPNNNNNA